MPDERSELLEVFPLSGEFEQCVVSQVGVLELIDILNDNVLVLLVLVTAR